VYRNLLLGFKKDGISVGIFRPQKKHFKSLMLLQELRNTPFLKNFDAVMYIGSIPWPSSILLSASDTKRFLFVHGYVYHELMPTIKEGNTLVRVDALRSLLLYEAARILKAIDYFVCHSVTTCDMARIPSSRRIIVPQFFLEEDLDFYESLRYKYENLKKQSNTIRIVTYGSHAHSPRLLTSKHMMALGKILKHNIKRNIEFIIIDPFSEPYEDGIIRVIKPLPRERYLQLVASSNIYVERCIDEELGYGALEAMAMGTPVAKVTHPLYKRNIDYERALMNASSINELAKFISQIIESGDLERYSQNGMKYVREKLAWNSVKFNLYKAMFDT